jgi:hypothetical protein
MPGKSPFLQEIEMSGKWENWFFPNSRTVSGILECIENRNEKRLYDRYKRQYYFLIYFKDDYCNVEFPHSCTYHW